jgi:hypothetical protein
MPDNPIIRGSASVSVHVAHIATGGVRAGGSAVVRTQPAQPARR